ncbi:hypothetical protein D3C84_1135680 [compost metagenome]
MGGYSLRLALKRATSDPIGCSTQVFSITTLCSSRRSVSRLCRRGSGRAWGGSNMLSWMK